MNEPRPPGAWGRWQIMGAYWLVQAAMCYGLWPIVFAGTDPRHLWSQPEEMLTIAIVLAAVMGMQAILVIPVRAPRPSGQRRPRFETVLGALGIGGVAGYLSLAATTMADLTDLCELTAREHLAMAAAAGMVSAVIAGIALARRARHGMPVAVTMGTLALVSAHLAVAILLTGIGIFRLVTARELDVDSFLGPCLVVLAMSWMAGTVAMLAFARRRGGEVAVRSIATRLFLGTLVEVGLTIPVDVMVRRRTSCYCAESTMWGLSICWAIGSLILGPVIWLALLGKRRKRWYGGHCESCGYDMSGCMSAERCPECGSGWKPPKQSPDPDLQRAGL